MREQPGHNLARMGPADYITLVRLTLVAFMAATLTRDPTAALQWMLIALTTVIGVMDGVDGWVARRTGTASAFGARFDMETDALLILVLSVLVWQHDKAGAWVLLCGLMRYGFVAAGWILPWMARPLTPTRRGRTVAVIQYIGLGAALSPLFPSPASEVAAAATLSALAWSFALDIRRLATQA
jgi:phosphatidylglycerophosphate synthase